jgi:hypothetical protein
MRSVWPPARCPALDCGETVRATTVSSVRTGDRGEENVEPSGANIHRLGHAHEVKLVAISHFTLVCS